MPDFLRRQYFRQKVSAALATANTPTTQLHIQNTWVEGKPYKLPAAYSSLGLEEFRVIDTAGSPVHGVKTGSAKFFIRVRFGVKTDTDHSGDLSDERDRIVEIVENAIERYSAWDDYEDDDILVELHAVAITGNLLDAIDDAKITAELLLTGEIHFTQHRKG